MGPGRSWIESVRWGLSPELLAAILTPLFVVPIAFALVSSSGPASTPLPGAAVSSISPTTIPSTRPASPSVGQAISLTDRIISLNADLRDALAKERDASTLARLLRQLNTSLTYGLELSRSLEQVPGAAAVAARLRSAYGGLREAALEGLQASLTNLPAYRSAVQSILDQGPIILDLRAELVAIDEALAVTQTPQAATTLPQDTLIVNGGFESGTGSPWEVVSPAGPAGSQLIADPDRPRSGAAAARVSIVDTSDLRQAVIVRQAGIPVLGSTSYAGRLALRAESRRDVRVSIVSSSGRAHVSALVAIGPAWTTTDFEFSPLIDGDVRLEIDLGRSPITVWIDDVVLTPQRDDG